MTKDDAYNIVDALNNISMSLECILEEMWGSKNYSFIQEYINEIDRIADNIEERYLY